MTATTRSFDLTALKNTLFVSFELGEGRWALSFTSGFGEQVLRRSVRGRDCEAVAGAIQTMKERLGMSRDARVVSCYEAGRDGFWLHRFLEAHGVANLVVDSSSIEVSRRRRRAKTDRLDGESLLDLLLRHRAGSRKKVWSVVRVPTVEQEDRRHLHRELASAKKDRTRVTNRMKGLLANQGLTLDLKKDVPLQLSALRSWDGSPLPAGLRSRLFREWERVAFYTDLIERLESERRELLRKAEDPVIEKALQLAPKDAHILDSMGWVLYRQGRLEQAAEYLQKAFDLQPETEIAAHLGEVLWHLGRAAQARELWRAAQGREPNNETLKETLARLNVAL
jgi:transposase